MYKDRDICFFFFYSSLNFLRSPNNGLSLFLLTAVKCWVFAFSVKAEWGNSLMMSGWSRQKAAHYTCCLIDLMLVSHWVRPGSVLPFGTCFQFGLCLCPRCFTPGCYSFAWVDHCVRSLPLSIYFKVTYGNNRMEEPSGPPGESPVDNWIPVSIT